MQTINTQYPSAWWKQIHPSIAYYWEILPNTVSVPEVILSKRTELGILSNFAATPFTLDGERYASIEGFWQMMKYPEERDDPREIFPNIAWSFRRAEVGQMVGLDARHAGDYAQKNMQRMGIDWITYQRKRFAYKGKDCDFHYQLIYRAMLAKVHQNPQVKEILLSTGDLQLLPDHAPENDATPAYRYYEIYMKIRNELLANS